ncbi:uncharacterized protein BDZ99DRAFT_198123 [Mytilinidion resinicola]|uniref:SAP domain-containing protein n=1 Tax=Mytilinidion resinicola TaxID=574789 RepID=A0A6A6Z477_9PEZI|nr:uncharacterized protein BDZ99DRAFT_198123 [Mytilinidion resinicola]KAF2815539.1 hypothetical protein BDZ99DRAFT_198123 [Mytilinidion resinicola]
MDYSKLKNAELEALLKSRNLPHTGKKADMVTRLQDADKKPSTTQASAVSDSLAAEDEIDWDDDTTEATATVTKPAATSEPATAAVAAGGQGQVANPQAVPNQVTDIDPAKTDDLTVKQPAAEDKGAEPASKEAKAEEKVEEKPKVDFTKGLAKTTLDEEIEKRKKRAEKFGIPLDDNEELKKLERAKKFSATEGPKGINEALPDRPLGRKRGREGADEGRRGDDIKRRGGRSDGRRGRGPRDDARGPREGGRGPRDNERGPRDGDRRPRNEKRERRASPGGGPAWMSEADRVKAEARKAKFGAPTASAT